MARQRHPRHGRHAYYQHRAATLVGYCYDLGQLDAAEGLQPDILQCTDDAMGRAYLAGYHGVPHEGGIGAAA